MPRSMFGLASLWGGLTVLSICGTASAQWYPGSGGSSCGCSAPSYMGPPPIMRQTAAFFGAAAATPTGYAMNDVCGPPIACHIEQPVQTVHVQAVAPVRQTVVAVQPMQQVVQPIMSDVAVTEYRPVKRSVSKPVMSTEYVDQAVTVMTPVTESRTVNVPTTEYQTVTEYKTVQKQVGYWVTKNVPTNKMTAAQFDNRPNALGAMNRAAYNMRTAFTPPYQQVRTFVPQTMTCTVPCKKQVAVQGMKQVTYNTTRMQPTQTTRKVAVNKVTYQQQEVTVMAPYQVTKTMQVGTRVSYQAAGATAIGSSTGGSAIGLSPTPDPKASAREQKPTRTADQDGMNEKNFNNRNDSSSLEVIDPTGRQLTESDNAPKKFTATAKADISSSAIRVSQWNTRNPSKDKDPSNPQPRGKSAAMSIADSAR